MKCTFPTLATAALATGTLLASSTLGGSPSRLLLVDIAGEALYSTTAHVVQDIQLLGALPTGITAADLDASARLLWVVRSTTSGAAAAGTVDLATLAYTARGVNQISTQT